ncbi:MAG TPA: roadblock/LC7 domain-containing protein [Rugosimonospora sp.]|nr:roadblock/LC7 domain-containing protein [Rugosimonospora sp.]
MNTPASHQDPQLRARLDLLLTSFTRRLAGVSCAVASSIDGLPVAYSDSMAAEPASQLSAIISGVVGLTTGAAGVLTAGRVRQSMVEMDGGVLLIMAVGERALLAVVGAPDCDISRIGYEAALLAHRVAGLLEPDARVMPR